VSAGTGIDPVVLLAQWANETAWGSVVIGNNLGNIRCSPTTFCRYATLGDFATACVATWHNGNYAAVLAAVGAEAQLAAVCASPWSSGHYGGNLHPFYDPLEVYEMTPDEHNMLQQLHDALVPTSPGVASYVTNVLDVLNLTTTPQLKAIRSDVAGVLTAVKALNVAAGGLTPAQAQTLADIQVVLVRIENALKAA
jgi:hypothetical protein